MKQALTEREEETRPQFQVECDQTLPITLAPGEVRTITFEISIYRNSAHNVTVGLFLPNGFESLDPVSRSRGGLISVSSYPQSFSSCEVFQMQVVNGGVSYSKSVTLKAAIVPGSYNIGYTLSCDELHFNTYENPDYEIPVAVVEASSDSKETSNDQAAQTGDNA